MEAHTLESMAFRFLHTLYLWLKNRLSPLPSLAEMATARVAAADRDHALQLAAFDRELSSCLPPDDRFARMAPAEYWRLAACNQAGQYQSALGSAGGNLQQYANQLAQSQYNAGAQNCCGAAMSQGTTGILGASGSAYQGAASNILPDLLGL